MSKRSKIIGLVLAALILGVIVVVASRSREPSYRGRTLTSWLKECSGDLGSGGLPSSEAAVAIRVIGAERAMPHLLRMAHAQDGPIRGWIIRKNENWDIPCLRMREAWMAQKFAIAGFEALGTNCASAVPQLARLIGDTNHACTAVMCLAGIGRPSEAPVCQALTNPSPDVRCIAASQLARVTDDLEVYLARLIGPLNDPNARVRSAAVLALGSQAHHSDAVIPLLVKALQDPDQHVSQYATHLLGSLGTNGMKAFDALSDVAQSGNAPRARDAMRSLVFIDPDRALPTVLRWLRSSEAIQRAQAASILGAVNSVTPEIVAALKAALPDAGSGVRGAATTALVWLRRKSREAGSAAVIIIPGEPSYWGKSLREWLQTRDGVDLSVEARIALRQMGTNAIPALLGMLTYRDPEFGVWDDDLCQQAVLGFNVLGKAGAPALPKLKELIAGRDEQLARYALSAAANMGKNYNVLNALRIQSERDRTAAESSSTDTGSGAAADGAKK
jgi:HEAT repeat protein